LKLITFPKEEKKQTNHQNKPSEWNYNFNKKAELGIKYNQPSKVKCASEIFRATRKKI